MRNKGLEALKTIRHIHDMECGEDERINKDFDIIEKELKRLEDYDKTEYSALIESHKKLLKEKKANEKYFKAVDFLLENGLIDLGYDEEEGSYYMNLNCGKILISDEEYKLWKEILRS